ncbi:MAG: type II secretion system F family protein [Gallionellaceae bacterium]|jgi:general secretion pathway protein F
MRYEVKALRGSEGLTAFALDAADAGDATAQAMAQGYTVIAIKAKQTWHVSHKPRKTKFPLVLFSQELLALLDAGLALVEALETLAEKEQRPDVKKTLDNIVTCLYEGHPLSYALRHSEASFPPLYVAAVHASETSGALPEALARYVTYQTQMDGVRQHLVSASVYPVLLAGVGGLVMVFLMLYVVPRFSHIYADIGGDLPFMSRLLMGWGQFISDHGESLLGGVVLLLMLLFYLFTRPSFKQWLTLALWHLPAVGARLHLYQLARFYRSLGMLLRGGMPVVTALKMVSDLLQQSLYDQLALATTSIREGQSISQSMERNGLTTPVALRMLRVGERTGKMGEMMERIASFYEEETARWVERFSKLFEPLLMVFIGLLIGGIVVLMYLPIFELAGSIQ